MKRYASELPDFVDLLVAAAAWKNLPPGIVEKDYYLTRSLSALTTALGGQFVLKGGTSLSKGWNLLERFSEDIDLLLKVQTDSGNIPGGERDRRLKRACAILENADELRLVEKLRSEKGIHRGAVFSYPRRVDVLSGLSAVIKLEAGTRGRAFPAVVKPIRSFVGEFAAAQKQTGLAQDLVPFKLELLDVRRTFVEKLFAVHHAFVENHAMGQTRHYYDLYRLCQLSEVSDFAGSEEYKATVADVRAVSEEHFPGSAFPEGNSFAASSALVPIGDELEILARNYQREHHLFFVKPPELSEILAVVNQLLPRL